MHSMRPRTHRPDGEFEREPSIADALDHEERLMRLRLFFLKYPRERATDGGRMAGAVCGRVGVGWRRDEVV